jgi:hypothetical protein
MQGCVPIILPVKDHGEMCGKETGASHSDERRERMRTDEPVDYIYARLFIEFGDIHLCSLNTE